MCYVVAECVLSVYGSMRDVVGGDFVLTFRQ